MNEYAFDGENRVINLTAGTIFVSVRDLWSRWVDWFITDDNSKYPPAMRFVGGDALPGDKELGLTYFMLNDWKLRPYSGDHTLNIDGNLYSADGSSPYTNAIGGFNVMIINSVSSLVDSSIKQLPEIEYASYNGGVTIDTVNGTDSSEYPYGTPKFPCKTVTNSYLIRLARGFTKIYLKSDILLVGIPDGILRNLELIGVGGNRKHTITVNNILATDCSVENVRVIGTSKTGSTVKVINCEVNNFENVAIIAEDCYIHGGLYKDTELSNCRVDGLIKIAANGRFSGANIIFEGDYTSIDCNNSTSMVSLDIDSGYVKIINSVETCLLEFNLRGGELELDTSCIGGELYVEGYGKLYNSSQVTIKGNNLQSVIIPEAVWDTQILEHQTAGSTGKTLSNVTGSNLTKETIRAEFDTNSLVLQALRNMTPEMHQLQGLDQDNPMLITSTSRIVGDIELDYIKPDNTESIIVSRKIIP